MMKHPFAVSVSALTLIGCLSLIFGFMANSSALAADGIFTLLLATVTLRSGNNRFVRWGGLLGGIAVFVLSCAALYGAFSQTMMTIGYLDEIAELWVLPVVAVTLFAKVFLLSFVKETALQDLCGELRLSLFLSGLVFVGILLSYFSEFYMQTVVAAAIAACCIQTAVRSVIRKKA